MLLTRMEEWVFAGGRASYRRVEITSIIQSCLLRNSGVSVGSLDRGRCLRREIQPTRIRKSCFRSEQNKYLQFDRKLFV